MPNSKLHLRYKLNAVYCRSPNAEISVGFWVVADIKFWTLKNSKTSCRLRKELSSLPACKTSSQPKIRQQWLSAAGDTELKQPSKQNQKQGLISALALDFS